MISHAEEKAMVFQGYDVRFPVSHENVDLQNKTCTCGEFQDFQLPCKHAIVVTQTLKYPVEDVYGFTLRRNIVKRF